jgi:hypothetical protein
MNLWPFTESSVLQTMEGMHTAHCMMVIYISLNSCLKFKYRFILFTSKNRIKSRLANEEITVISFQITLTWHLGGIIPLCNSPSEFLLVSLEFLVFRRNLTGIPIRSIVPKIFVMVISVSDERQNITESRYQQYLCLSFSAAKLQYIFQVIKQWNKHSIYGCISYCCKYHLL